ncbi:MAG: helix-hairpin-helix domain-containing protein [Actinomycetota bacterium]|nr:helix-hairpin-helix domain-containing protein [Actinomycetota bacterium]
MQGIRRYLGSGLIKGIGTRLAEKIVEHFGVQALEVIETAPDRLIDVPKLGPKRTKLITEAGEEQKVIKEVMVFFFARCWGFHRAGGADLQAVHRRRDRRGPHAAVSVGLRGVGDRVQNR